MAMIEKRKDGAMMIEVTVDTGTDLSLTGRELSYRLYWVPINPREVAHCSK